MVKDNDSIRPQLVTASKTKLKVMTSHLASLAVPDLGKVMR